MKKIILFLFLSLSIVSYSQTSRPVYQDIAVSGAGSAYTFTSGTVLSLQDGLTYSVAFTSPPTGASTLNVNGTGIHPLVDASGNVLTSSSFTAGFKTDIRYDAGTSKWWLVGGSGGGITDGDKGDITVSGSGATWIIDPATVTGSKITSSVALAGSPTTTTQTAGDNSTNIATTAYVDNNKKKTLGPLFNNTGAFSGANYTQVGTTFTINTGTISGNSGGVAGTFTNNISYNYVTMNQNYVLEATYTLGTVNGTSTGLGFGINPTSTGTTVGYTVVYDCSNGANAGKILMYSVIGGIPTLIATTTGALPTATGDQIQMRLYSGRQKGVVEFRNVTQNKSISTATLTSLAIYPIPTDALFGVIGNFNIGKFAIWNFGFQGSISTFKCTSTEIKNPDIICVGDSQTKGSGSMMPNEGWPERLARDLGMTVVTEAGAGVNSIDALTIVNEIISYNPKIAVLLIGTNDVGLVGGSNIATLEANLPIIVTALQAAGITVYLPELIPRGLAGIATHNTWLATNYPSLLIGGIYLGMTDGATPGNMIPAYSGDNLHPNTTGHYILASLIGRGIIPNYDRQIATNQVSIPVTTIGNAAGRNLTIGTNDAYSPVIISGNGRSYFNNYNAGLLGSLNLSVNSSNINDGLYQAKNDHASGRVGFSLIDVAGVMSSGWQWNNSTKAAAFYADGGTAKLQLESYNDIDFLLGNSYSLQGNWNTTKLSLTNGLLVGGLAGAGTRMVTADGSGNLGSSVIPIVPVVATDAIDADYTAVINTIKYLPAATLSQNRTITIPAGSNGDVLEIYNNESGFAWLISGSIYLSDGTTTITQLLANTNYIIRKVSGKWRIAN